MKHQPKQGTETNDDIQTPPELCRILVEHFKPRGVILEPCRGDGNFEVALMRHANPHAEIHSCEIKDGFDFYDLDDARDFDWVLTNPPWSLLSERTKPMSFLEKALQVSYNVVFLCTLNHLIGLKARYKLLDRYGFGVCEVVLLDTPPKPWPQAGFQVGAVHFKKDYQGNPKWTDFRQKAAT